MMEVKVYKQKVKHLLYEQVRERVTLHQSLNKPDVQLAFLNSNSYCIDRSIQENNIAELKAENMVRKKRKKRQGVDFSKELNTR